MATISDLVALTITFRAASILSSSSSSFVTLGVALALSWTITTLQYPKADRITRSSALRDNNLKKPPRFMQLPTSSVKRSCKPTESHILVRSARISVVSCLTPTDCGVSSVSLVPSLLSPEALRYILRLMHASHWGRWFCLLEFNVSLSQ